jgi:hypothetical protein
MSDAETGAYIILGYHRIRTIRLTFQLENSRRVLGSKFCILKAPDVCQHVLLIASSHCISQNGHLERADSLWHRRCCIIVMITVRLQKLS